MPTENPTQVSPPAAIETAPPQENQQQKAELQEDEAETSQCLTDAERRLKEAAEKLDKIIPDDMKISAVDICADVNSLADNVGSAITTLMAQRNIDKLNEHVLKSLTKRWIKKVFPFLQQGLKAAAVLRPVYFQWLTSTASDSCTVWIDSIGRARSYSGIPGLKMGFSPG